MDKKVLSPGIETLNKVSEEIMKPDNNLALAIASLIIFLPLGIVAILNSNKVETLWAIGNYKDAKDMADKSKQWSILGIAIGSVLWLLLLASGDF